MSALKCGLPALLHRLRWLIGPFVAFCSTQPKAQVEFGSSPAQQARSAFAAYLVLTDTEAITFGLHTFDPDAFFGLVDEQFGDEETVERQRSVTTYALPGRWQLSPEEDRLRNHASAGLSYLSMVQENVPAGPDSDRTLAQVYGAYAEYGVSFKVNDKLTATAGLGAHLNQYDNQLEPGSETLELLDELPDDARARVLIGEWRGRLNYTSETRGVPWELQTTYSYYHGRTLSSGSNLEDAAPETWSWTNGVTVRRHLSPVFNRANNVRLISRRVDVGGDVVEALGTRHYYQFDLGWVFETPGGFSWLKNIGASIIVNTGSALSGASLGLIYNEEY